MRKPTDIKVKIKQIKYEYLKQFYREKLTVKPENCFYNKPVVLHDTKEYKTRVCTYFSGVEQYQICNTVSCAEKCNAFVLKHSKNALRDQLETDIEKNPGKYPEVVALNWVLEQKPERHDFTFKEKVKFELVRVWTFLKGIWK